MLTDARLILALAVYVLVARLALALRPRWRDPAFAITNVATVAVVFYWTIHPKLLFISCYVGLAAVHWYLCRRYASADGWRGVLPVAFPILVLILIKYVPGYSGMLATVDAGPNRLNLAFYFVGLSYVAFRLSHLVIEVRNGIVEPPSFWQHLAYTFFPATMVLGPINPYSVHARSLAARGDSGVPWVDAAWRVLVGLTKYVVAANIFNQLSYSGLATDSRPHPRVDWLVSGVFYYGYLYANFSGFCDIGIGIAAMLGIEVRENFDRPYVARNMGEFWNRWHITLSTYMRDMVFTPLSKRLIRNFGPRHQNHAVSVSTFTVFVLIGIWHGVGFNYLLFGIVNAVGVVTHHYYRLALRRRLSVPAFRAYNQNRLIHFVSIGITFLYVTASLAVFANDRGLARTREFFH